MNQKWKTYLEDPWKLFNLINNGKLLYWIPDVLFLKIAYWCNMGKRLDLEHPETYTEKLQWLKLYDREDSYTTLVDKYEVKKYVEGRIGKKYVIPALGVWDSFDEIAFEQLPEQFVLKCSHDVGGAVICRDKTSFNKKVARRKIMKSLKRDYYKLTREWAYKEVPHRIIAEPYIAGEGGSEPTTYRFFCFNGDVKHVLTYVNETKDRRIDLYDRSFHRLPVANGASNARKADKKPKEFDEMKRLASRLSRGFCQICIDFYNVSGRIYFEKMVMFHGSGFMEFEPEEWDLIFGEYVRLPQ